MSHSHPDSGPLGEEDGPSVGPRSELWTWLNYLQVWGVECGSRKPELEKI